MHKQNHNKTASAYLRGQSMKINPFRKKKMDTETGSSKPPPNSVPVATSCLKSPEAGPFPLHALPSSVQGIVSKLSRASSLPAAMIALGALAVVSAAIGRKFSTRLSWREDLTLCNLIVLLGSYTASGKGILSKLLSSFLGCESEFLSAHVRRLADYELDYHLAEERYAALRKQIVKKDALGLECAELRHLAVEQLREKRLLKGELSRKPVLCMRHPTGAALRDAFADGDQSLFIFSLDGASCLMDAVNGKDRNLRRYVLSGFSGENTGSETSTQGKFGGEICLSSLFTMQPHLLREMLFNEKAAAAGLLNRPLIIDDEFLDEGASVERIEVKDPRAWDELIKSLFNNRFSASNHLSIGWGTEAEKEFKAFDYETSEVLKDWPENAREHSGRVLELCVRLAGIFLAILAIHEKKDAKEESVQLDAAKRAVEIMRWVFRHRLRIQADAYSKFISSRAGVLEKKLKAKGGNLLVSEIRDDHPQLLPYLDAVVERYPHRFCKSMRKGARGPAGEAIFLID